MDWCKRFMVKPGCKVRLDRIDPDECLDLKDRDAVEKEMAGNRERLRDLQYRLYAENRRAILIVLQALDAGGKDGTIRHVISAFNPQSCHVTSFKVPSAEETAHDFLWRCHKEVPGKGKIGVFNRSHYEGVLVERVHNIVPRAVWSRRYGQINMFEKILAQNDTVIMKFYLHISRDEQRKRLLKRIEDPDRRWKVSPNDLRERKYWKEYRAAFEAALERCSTADAPWYIIPADRKWFRNLAVSHIIMATMERMKMRFPDPVIRSGKIRID